MRKVAPILVLRLALLAAILASAVLAVEFDNPGDPAFCGSGSACMALERSPYGHIDDIPLPLLGLCALAGLLALAVVAREKEHTFFVAAAAAGGAAVGLGLAAFLALRVGVTCKWCMVAQGCAVLAGGAAVLVHVQAARSAAYEGFLRALAERRALVVAWVAGATIVAGLPFVWGEFPKVPQLPPAIADLGVPGKITIVSFTDFEYPLCRKLAPVIQDVGENWGDRAVLVREMAPLASDPGALPAALAYVCTPDEAREEMSRKLYGAPDAVLTRDGVQIIARDLHLDEARFARCLDGPAAKARVAAERAIFDALDVHLLPLTYIGARAVAGYSPDALRRFGREAMDSERLGLPLWWMVAAALAVGALLAVLTVKLAPRDADPGLGSA